MAHFTNWFKPTRRRQPSIEAELRVVGFEAAYYNAFCLAFHSSDGRNLVFTLTDDEILRVWAGTRSYLELIGKLPNLEG